MNLLISVDRIVLPINIADKKNLHVPTVTCTATQNKPTMLPNSTN